MSDTLLASLLSALDAVVFERLPNAVFMQVTPSPAWFTHVFGAESAGQAITLSQAFPFLDTFLTDAEAFWLARRPGALRSGPFTATAPEGDVLLRATVATVGRRPLLVIERLVGLADPRDMLQVAREKDLEHERVTKEILALRSPLDALGRAADELLDGDLTPRQRVTGETVRQMTDRIAGVVRRFAADQAPDRPKN